MSNLFCLVCNKSFPETELSGHVISVHFGFLPFACTCCEFIAAQESEVLRHADKEGHIPFVADRTNVKPYLSLLTSLIVGHCQTFAESRNFTEILSGLTSQIAANKNGLVRLKCQIQIEPNRDADVSSERSSSTLRSALISNSLAVNSPVSITENSSLDSADSKSANQHSSVQTAADVTQENKANMAPKVNSWEDQDHDGQEVKPDATEMCALCISDEVFHAQQKEGHVIRHVERSGASADQNPAIFFASIADMWQRCFQSQTPPSDDVAMETQNDVSPKCHVTKKPKHLKGHSLCTLCNKCVRISAKKEHVWQEHMDFAVRFSCGSCAGTGLAKIDLEQACADLHPDIPADIKPIPFCVQQHARQYFLCFGSYPGPDGKPSRSSLSTTPSSTEPPEALLPAAASPLISVNRRCSSRHLNHIRKNEVEQSLTSPKSDPDSGLRKLHWRHMTSLQASKKGKAFARRSTPVDLKQVEVAVTATAAINECQLCSAKISSSATKNRRTNLKAHALARHFDGPQKLFGCSACGFGDNSWQCNVVAHVKKRHASDKGVRVFDRRAKYAARIKRCFDACFPSANLTVVRKTGQKPASSTEDADLGRDSAHPSSAGKPGSKMHRLRVALVKKQTKNRFTGKPKRAARILAGNGICCRLCAARICDRSDKLSDHALRNHFQHPRKIYECSKCGFGDNTWPYFVVNHVKKAHVGEKSVRVIDRYAKLIPKIQTCLESCFPGIGLVKKKYIKETHHEVAAPSDEGSSYSVHDEPGTSGYAAIGLDTSDNQLDFNEFEGNDRGMPLVAIKKEHVNGVVHAIRFGSGAENGEILKMESSDV